MEKIIKNAMNSLKISLKLFALLKRKFYEIFYFFLKIIAQMQKSKHFKYQKLVKGKFSRNYVGKF